ncbi:MAG: aldo/keto reductase [Anaerolineaceae bacterium]|nr:aldo/keto reductase [Anaerolineaceae bacterium]
MENTHPGRSGLLVSRLCLGTMNFGARTDEAESRAIMDAALDVGINFFDTANIYGAYGGDLPGYRGLTEDIMGRWFAQGGGRREKVVLATKVYNPTGDWPNEGKLSALHIRRACEASLRRLQTDYIDIYQVHHVDRETPWGEIWQAMEQLIREGKILYVGSSNHAGWHIVKANEAAQRRNLPGLISEQCKYSLAERRVEFELLPACQDYGVGVIPWSPLHGGLLGGVLRKLAGGRRASAEVQGQIDGLRPQLERYEAFCGELGEEPADVALAWLLAQPAVTAPIIGPADAEQLRGSLRALELRLDAEQLAALDDIWPGPGGEAPESW